MLSAMPIRMALTTLRWPGFTGTTKPTTAATSPMTVPTIDHDSTAATRVIIAASQRMAAAPSQLMPATVTKVRTTSIVGSPVGEVVSSVARSPASTAMAAMAATGTSGCPGRRCGGRSLAAGARTERAR